MKEIRGGRKYAATQHGVYVTAAVTLVALAVMMREPILAPHVATLLLGYYGAVGLIVAGHSGANALASRGTQAMTRTSTETQNRVPL